MMSHKRSIQTWIMRIESQEPAARTGGLALPPQAFDPNQTALEQTAVAKMRRRRHVRPAGSIIRCDKFLPDDYKAFIEWQLEQSERVSPHTGFISSAEEYHLFLHREPPAPKTPTTPTSWSFNWRNLGSIFWGPPKTNKPKKPYCGHKQHPRARTQAFCPTCQVEHCFDMLTLISEKWTELGAPYRDAERVTHPDYKTWKDAWLGARLELVQLVDRLEMQAVVQEKFDRKGTSAKNKQSVGEVRTARMALEYVREKYNFSLAGPAVPEEEDMNSGDGNEGRVRKKRKTARFGEDVKEPSGRQPREFRSKIDKFDLGDEDLEDGERAPGPATGPWDYDMFEKEISATGGDDSRLEDYAAALEKDDAGRSDEVSAPGVWDYDTFEEEISASGAYGLRLDDYATAFEIDDAGSGDDVHASKADDLWEKYEDDKRDSVLGTGEN